MNILYNLAYLSLIFFIALLPLLPSFGRYNINLILIILIFFQLIYLIFSKEAKKYFIYFLKNIKNDFLSLSLICFNLTMYISILVSQNKISALGHSIKFSMYLFIFFAISYNIKNIKQLSILINSLVITNLIIGLISLYQIVILFNNGSLINESNRIISTLENPNNLGAYMILSIFIVFSLILSNKNIFLKFFYSLVFLLQILNIVSCQSRNALLALVLGSFLITILYNKRYIIFAIILPIVLLIIPQSRIRLFEVFNMDQNVSRIKLWKLTGIMIKENPFTGIGYNNYEYVYGEYVAKNSDLMIWDGYHPYHPHNILLKVQSELGILGTLTFIALIIATIYIFIKLIKSSIDKKTKVIIIGIFTSILAFQSMNLIDCYYNSPKALITLLIVLGFINCYNNIFTKKILSFRN